MNAQNTDNFQLQGCVANFTLFQQLFVREEKKAQLSIPTQNMLNLSSQKKIKKKGRPKADKALLEKVRKDGNDDSGIDRQKGHWSNQENKKYHLFLQIHHMHFLQREMRRVDKIFKSMASFLKTREAQQCRSHHQKMQKKYNNFGNILLYLRRSNYGTQDQSLVLSDLRIEMNESPKLLSGQQLLNMAVQKKEEKDVKNRVSVRMDGKEENLEVNKVSFENLLGDNYENQFGLNFFN